MRPSKITFPLDQIVEEYKKLGSCAAVAKKYGCCQEIVRLHLIEAGCQRTGSGTSHKKHIKTQTEIEKEKEIIEQRVTAYLRYQSSTKAAEICGCDSKTILRALKKAGIPATGIPGAGAHRSHKPYAGAHRRSKLTTEDLAREAKTLSIYEIAKKHDVGVQTIYRRAKKNGINIKCGGGYFKWKAKVDFYGVGKFDDSVTLLGVINRDRGVCQICGLPVDNNAKRGSHILRDYPTVDHIIPLSKGGSHTWENVQLAHMGCNAKKGARIGGA